MNPRAALAWSFAERYASFVIAFASTVVLARLLTPAQVGVFSMCMALLAVLGIVRDFGVSEYLIQESDLTPERFASACGVALAVAWALALALWLLRHPIADFFEEPMVASVLGVLCLQLLLLPLTSPLFAVLNRELAFRRIFALQIVSNSLQAVVTLGLAWGGYGSLALAWGPVVNIAAQTTLLVAWGDTRTRFVRPRLQGWRQVLRFGLPYAGARALETLARNVHEPIIARTVGFAGVGLFSRAQGLVEMFHTSVSDAVVRVATPAFASAHRQAQSVQVAYARATTIYVSLSWPFLIFVALLAQEIVGLLFGERWTASAPLASILALAALPAGLYELAPQMLSATGHVQRRLRVAWKVAPVHIVAVLLAAQHSLYAVAAVSSLTGVWTLWVVSRELAASHGLGLAALLRGCGGSALVTLVAAVVTWAAAAGTRGAGAGHIATLLVSAVALMAGWWIAVNVLGHPSRDEIMAVVSRWRRRSADKEWTQ